MRQRSPLWLALLALVLLAALLSLARQQARLQFLELAAYDLLVAGVGTGFRAPAAVSLLLISESDIQRLGNWPLSDQQLHDILSGVLALGPKAVGVDIYRDLAVPPGAERLRALLGGDPRILAIEKFPAADSPGVPPPRVLRDTGRVGFSDLISDPGGVVRRGLLFLSHEGRTGYAFSLQLALAYLEGAGIYPTADPDKPSHMRLGEVTLTPLEGNEGGYVDADAGGYQILLRYRDPPTAFAVHSLRDLRTGRIAADAIQGKLVIIGVAADSVKDYFTTPFSILDHRAGTLAGSLVHAHATQQLIDAALAGRRSLRVWSDRVELVWLWSWVGLGFLAGWFAGPLWRFTIIVLSGSSLAVAIAVGAYQSGWWIPVVPNLIGWVLAVALSSALLAAHRRRDQQALMSLFACHVSPEVAGAIWRRREEVLRDGRVLPRTLTVTTLFTDLQGFTRVSEQLDPEPFMRWLNSYMAELTDVIMEYGGVLDDYAGDGIKANFGVPFSETGQIAYQARRSIECALALGEALNRLNREWAAKGRDNVAMRVGVHTGLVVVGTVGSRARMKYTTVGRNVNLAARLEGLRDCPSPDPDDELSSCRILVSESTAGLVADAFEICDLGLFDLKGITEKTRVFAIIGSKPKEHEHVDS